MVSGLKTIIDLSELHLRAFDAKHPRDPQDSNTS